MANIKPCPPSLYPQLKRNMATGGISLVWPDICYCPKHGPDVHAVEEDCVDINSEDGQYIVEWCACETAPPSQAVNTQCADGSHVDGCPFNDCPLGTCHPMCSQVTGDSNDLWCHCACHG